MHFDRNVLDTDLYSEECFIEFWLRKVVYIGYLERTNSSFIAWFFLSLQV